MLTPLNDLGILATTVFGSAGGVGKADFSPLRGREVIIWPDNDEPGRKFADQVAVSLREAGAATVRIVPREALRLKPMAWDAADAINDGWGRADVLKFIKNAGPLKASEALRPPGRIRSVWNALKGGDPLMDSEAIKDIPLKDTDAFKENGSFKEPANDSLKLKEQGWGEPDMSVLNPRPKPPEFPTQLFGPFWAKWISSQAESKSAPVDYVGATLLVSASTAIGNARWVSPWEGWTEPSHLWAALVGNPSSGKSPAMDPVMDLIRKIEADEAEGHADSLRQYEADVIAANYVRDQWEKDVKTAAKEGYPPPLKPEAAMEPLKPQRPRLRVSDATPESLMSLLSQLPKGVLMTRDELAGWIGSFNRYAGGEGGDRAFWLEAWGARSYTVDRVKNGKAIIIPHLSIGVLGGIQPDKLASALLKGDDDGLRARFMYFWPDPVPLERPKNVLGSMEALKAFRALHGLEMGNDEHGNARPVIVSLTEEAADFFQAWRVAKASTDIFYGCLDERGRTEAMDFLPSLIVLGFLGVAGFASRSFIKAWIDSRVRSASQKDLEQFRSELDAEKANLAAVRDSVLSGRTSRQSIVDQRRFDAIDQLWLAVRDIDRYAAVPRFLESVNLEAVCESFDEEPKIPQLFGFILKATPGEFKAPITTFLDHYVPEKILNLYGLYTGIVGTSVSIAVAASNGLNPGRFVRGDTMNDEVKKHLPHFSDYVDEFGVYSWVYLAQVARDALALEIRSFVEGTEADYGALEKSALEHQTVPPVVAEALDKLPEKLKH